EMEAKKESRSYKPDKKRRQCRRGSWQEVKDELNSLSKFLDEMIHREEARSALKETEL
ncbi:unnamed protein product, partial [Dovyalis caffra]